MQTVAEKDVEKLGMIVKRVSVPIGLEELMEGLTKEVLLKKPKDLYIFASEYFSRLVILRERSSNQKAYTIRTAQSITQLKTQDVIKGKKISPARPIRHLSRQLSMRSRSPVATKTSQSETTRNTTQKSRDRRLTEEKKENAPKAPLKATSRRERSISTNRKDVTPRSTSSVQSTPREIRQSSTSRQSKPATNQLQKPTGKKTERKVKNDKKPDSLNKEKAIEGSKEILPIDKKVLDSDICAASTNVLEVSKSIVNDDDKEAESDARVDICVFNEEIIKKEAPEGKVAEKAITSIDKTVLEATTKDTLISNVDGKIHNDELELASIQRNYNVVEKETETVQEDIEKLPLVDQVTLDSSMVTVNRDADNAKTKVEPVEANNSQLISADNDNNEADRSKAVEVVEEIIKAEGENLVNESAVTSSSEKRDDDVKKGSTTSKNNEECSEGHSEDKLLEKVTKLLQPDEADSKTTENKSDGPKTGVVNIKMEQMGESDEVLIVSISEKAESLKDSAERHEEDIESRAATSLEAAQKTRFFRENKELGSKENGEIINAENSKNESRHAPETDPPPISTNDENIIISYVMSERIDSPVKKMLNTFLSSEKQHVFKPKNEPTVSEVDENKDGGLEEKTGINGNAITLIESSHDLETKDNSSVETYVECNKKIDSKAVSKPGSKDVLIVKDDHDRANSITELHQTTKLSSKDSFNKEEAEIATNISQKESSMHIDEDSDITAAKIPDEGDDKIGITKDTKLDSKEAAIIENGQQEFGQVNHEITVRKSSHDLETKDNSSVGTYGECNKKIDDKVVSKLGSRDVLIVEDDHDRANSITELHQTTKLSSKESFKKEEAGIATDNSHKESDLDITAAKIPDEGDDKIGTTKDTKLGSKEAAISDNSQQESGQVNHENEKNTMEREASLKDNDSVEEVKVVDLAVESSSKLNEKIPKENHLVFNSVKDLLDFDANKSLAENKSLSDKDDSSGGSNSLKLIIMESNSSEGNTNIASLEANSETLSSNTRSRNKRSITGEEIEEIESYAEKIDSSCQEQLKVASPSETSAQSQTLTSNEVVDESLLDKSEEQQTSSVSIEEIENKVEEGNGSGPGSNLIENVDSNATKLKETSRIQNEMSRSDSLNSDTVPNKGVVSSTSSVKEDDIKGINDNVLHTKDNLQNEAPIGQDIGSIEATNSTSMRDDESKQINNKELLASENLTNKEITKAEDKTVEALSSNDEAGDRNNLQNKKLIKSKVDIDLDLEKLKTIQGSQGKSAEEASTSSALGKVEGSMNVSEKSVQVKKAKSLDMLGNELSDERIRYSEKAKIEYRSVDAASDEPNLGLNDNLSCNENNLKIKELDCDKGQVNDDSSMKIPRTDIGSIDAAADSVSEKHEGLPGKDDNKKDLSLDRLINKDLNNDIILKLETAKMEDGSVETATTLSSNNERATREDDLNFKDNISHNNDNLKNEVSSGSGDQNRIVSTEKSKICKESAGASANSESIDKTSTEEGESMQVGDTILHPKELLSSDSLKIKESGKKEDESVEMVMDASNNEVANKEDELSTKENVSNPLVDAGRNNNSNLPIDKKVLDSDIWAASTNVQKVSKSIVNDDDKEIKSDAGVNICVRNEELIKNGASEGEVGKLVNEAQKAITNTDKILLQVATKDTILSNVEGKPHNEKLELANTQPNDAVVEKEMETVEEDIEKLPLVDKITLKSSKVTDIGCADNVKTKVEPVEANSIQSISADNDNNEIDRSKAVETGEEIIKAEDEKLVNKSAVTSLSEKRADDIIKKSSTYNNHVRNSEGQSEDKSLEKVAHLLQPNEADSHTIDQDKNQDVGLSQEKLNKEKKIDEFAGTEGEPVQKVSEATNTLTSHNESMNSKVTEDNLKNQLVAKRIIESKSSTDNSMETPKVDQGSLNVYSNNEARSSASTEVRCNVIYPADLLSLKNEEIAETEAEAVKTLVEAANNILSSNNESGSKEDIKPKTDMDQDSVSSVGNLKTYQESAKNEAVNSATEECENVSTKNEVPCSGELLSSDSLKQEENAKTSDESEEKPIIAFNKTVKMENNLSAKENISSNIDSLASEEINSGELNKSKVDADQGRVSSIEKLEPSQVSIDASINGSSKKLLPINGFKNELKLVEKPTNASSNEADMHDNSLHIKDDLKAADNILVEVKTDQVPIDASTGSDETKNVSRKEGESMQVEVKVLHPEVAKSEDGSGKILGDVKENLINEEFETGMDTKSKTEIKQDNDVPMENLKYDVESTGTSENNLDNDGVSKEDDRHSNDESKCPSDDLKNEATSVEEIVKSENARTEDVPVSNKECSNREYSIEDNVSGAELDVTYEVEQAGGIKISKGNTFVKDRDKEGTKRHPKIGDIEQVASVIEVVKNIYDPKSSTEKSSVTAVREYLSKFLQNEQEHNFIHNTNESVDLTGNKINEKSEVNNNKNISMFKSTQERSLSETNNNILNSEKKGVICNARRARSVGIIKMGDIEPRTKIPVPARRSAGRRPLVRQLEADSKELEEKLNFRKSSTRSSENNSADKENNKKDINGLKKSAANSEDVLIAKAILKGVEGAEKHIELIEEHLNNKIAGKILKDNKQEEEIRNEKLLLNKNVSQELKKADLVLNGETPKGMVKVETTQTIQRDDSNKNDEKENTRIDTNEITTVTSIQTNLDKDTEKSVAKMMKPIGIVQTNDTENDEQIDPNKDAEYLKDNSVKTIEQNSEDIVTKLDQNDETKAAVQIQSAWRGFIVRKIMLKSNQNTSTQEKAVVLIQAVARGFLDRLKYNKLKARNVNSVSEVPNDVHLNDHKLIVLKNSMSKSDGAEDTDAESTQNYDTNTLNSLQAKGKINGDAIVRVTNIDKEQKVETQDGNENARRDGDSKVNIEQNNAQHNQNDDVRKDLEVHKQLLEPGNEKTGTDEPKTKNTDSLAGIQIEDAVTDKLSPEKNKRINSNSTRSKESEANQNDTPLDNTPLNETTHDEDIQSKMYKELEHSDFTNSSQKGEDKTDPNNKAASNIKPDFYRSNTVIEPTIIKKSFVHLEEDSVESEAHNGDGKDNNNNKHDKKEETELERDVRSAIQGVLDATNKQDSKLTPLELEVDQAVKQIIDDKLITIDTVLNRLPEVPKDEISISQKTSISSNLLDATEPKITNKSMSYYQSRSENDENAASLDTPADDVSSMGSIDSVVTVILTPKDETLKKEENEADSKVSSKRLLTKALTTSALEDHVELIDQVQNSLLDQLSGKNLDTTNKFDIEQLRKELHDAATLYQTDEATSPIIDHDPEVMEYLYDFEPEDDSAYESRAARTPLRELADIAEEEDADLSSRKVDSEHDRRSFCGTEMLKNIEGKPLQDHVEVFNAKEKFNEIIINNDKIEMNNDRRRLLHTSELHDSVTIPVKAVSLSLTSLQSDSRTEPDKASKLKHTSEFHDTVVLPLPSGADVKIKNASTESSAKPNQASSMDSGNQTSNQHAPAGVEIVTSRRRSQDGVDVVEAQASLRDTAPAKPESGESFTHQSPPRSAEQAMESENNNNINKRNNAISNNNVRTAERTMESEAATKIQAGFRGYQVRKQMKAKGSATDQKRHLRKRSSRENMKDPDLEEKSAVKIQAGVRGFLVRRRQKKQVNSSASA